MGSDKEGKPSFEWDKVAKMEMTNQVIFKWLEPKGCYHNIEPRYVDGKIDVYWCPECRTAFGMKPVNPDYSTPSGFVELMKELYKRGKTIVGAINSEGNYWCGISGEGSWTATAPTPERAQMQATLKLIKGEK